MNETYFYQENGRTLGPIEPTDLRARIREGQLRVFDLVYRDGDPTWRMAVEHADLRSDFPPDVLAQLRDRPWVVLRRKAGEIMSFVTTGPFALEDIRQSLQTGKISYSDYAWKEGFPDWRRLGALEEFNPRSRRSVATPAPVVNVESAEALLRSVVEMQRPELARPEPPPSEVDPQDLATESYDNKNELTVVARPDHGHPPPNPRITVRTERLERPERREEKTKARVMPNPPPMVSETAIVSLTPGSGVMGALTRLNLRRQKLRLDWGVVGVLSMVLIGSVLLISRFHVNRSAPLEAEPPPALAVPPAPPTSTSTESVPHPPVVSQPAGETLDLAKPTPPKPTPQPHVKVRPPTELFLAVQTGVNSARIEIRTDAGPDFPVYVQIVGVPGQVTDGASFYRFLRFTPTGKATQPLDLSGVKLPQGRFVMRAETGDLKKETRFTLMASESQFRAAVVRQRKLAAQQFWHERLQLMQAVQGIEKSLSVEAVGEREKVVLKGMETLLNLKRSGGSEYVLFDDWWELHDIVTEAKESGSSPELVQRVQKEKDRIATLSIWK